MSTASETRITTHPARRQVRIKKVGDDLELSYRELQGCGACFLLVWLTGWTFGCVMLVRQALGDSRFFNFLAATPFLVSWIFVFCVLIWMLFGVERVRLGVEGLEHRVTALITLSRRLVPRAELRNVCAGLSARQVGDSKRGEQPCLKFETLGQPIEFACGISEEEQLWLVEWLNDYLDALGPHGPPEGYCTGHRYGIMRDRPGILQRAATPVDPPSDTRIERRYHLETIEFVWRGRWNLGAIASLTFICLFWNGGMGLLIFKQVEDFSWGLFLFTIPHQIIGLCIFGMWLTTLTAPLWELMWTFGEQQATRRLSIADEDALVFDLGWSQRFTVQPPVWIELRRRERKKQSTSLWQLLSHPEGDFTLMFLGAGDKEGLRIDRLTEGDARWIADVLLRAFPSWRSDEAAAVSR